MKSLIPLLFIISFFIISGCNEIEEIVLEDIIAIYDEGCEWDGYIPNETADQIKANWENKWDLPGGDAIPDSFFVNQIALELLAFNDPNGQCGFRVYYGLTQPGDITSMGLVIVAINLELTDQLVGKNKILFTNQTSFGNPESDSLKTIPISKNKAIEYTTNWRQYNGVCRDDVLLGNDVCKGPIVIGPIPPEGSLGANVAQLVPLGHGFTGLSLFSMILEEQPILKALVIHNVMYSVDSTELKKLGIDAEMGYRYDFLISGLEGDPSSGEMKHKRKDLFYSKAGDENCESEDCPVDISNGCPIQCGDDDTLQEN